MLWILRQPKLGGRELSNVEWLLREALSERRLPIGAHAAIDDERWRAVIERLEVGPGLRVFLTEAQAHRDITVEARDDRIDRWIGSQVTVTGRADIDFLDGTRTHAAAGNAVLFRPSGRRAAYSLRAGTRFRSAGFGLDIGRIARLFDNEAPEMLQGLLDAEVTSSRIVTMPSNRTMRGLADSLFDTSLNGALRTLMLEGAVIQLLAVQAAAASDASSVRRCRALSPREHDAVREARERLLADMRQPPSIGELATAVCLTERRLNAGFRALFGATVFETLRNERLDHARIALEAGELPIKQVAFRVGYNHVTNFINAFTAHFGTPPGQYRGTACRLRERAPSSRRTPPP